MPVLTVERRFDREPGGRIPPGSLFSCTEMREGDSGDGCLTLAHISYIIMKKFLIEGRIMSNFSTQINWYPGHMAKARRLLTDQLKRIDLVIELCDARLPYSSRNPDLIQLAGSRKRILLLNKSDLADPDVSRRWVQFFQDAGTEAYLSDARTFREKDFTAIIDRSTREIVQRALDKGVRKTVRAMVIGVPNVGKSTFINRLFGRSIAQTGDRPGVTRSNQWIRITPYLELMDTPGLLWPRLDDQVAARRMCYLGTIRDEILDLPELAMYLLEDLCEIRPERVVERFHIENPGLRGADLLDAVCRGRGWLQRGAQPDYETCGKVVMKEFREGKLGRITLESPEI